MADLMSNLFDTISRFGLEGVFRRYYGIYRGVVEDVDDPERRGRVRVAVPALGHRFAPREIWASICQSASNGHGVLSYYEPGDSVFVEFEGGAAENPVVVGGFLTTTGNPERFRGRPPVKRGFITTAGHVVELDDGDNTIRIESAGGPKLFLRGDGSAEWEASGASVSLAANGNVIAASSGGVRARLEGADGVLSAPSGASVSVGPQGVALESPIKVEVKAPSVTVQGGLVELGGGGGQSLMLGETFIPVFLTHVHPVPGGPPAPIPPIGWTTVNTRAR